MNERIYLVELFDCYKNLLTDKDIEIFNEYYEEDLSLSEVADEKNITRSAVFNKLKKVEEKLHDYENKLKIVSNKRKILELIEKKEYEKIVQYL